MRRLLLAALLLAAVPAFAETISVSASMCDGQRDASGAINAAIARAAQAGGVVLLPGGRCRIDLSVGAIVPRSGVTLRGEGQGATILVIDDLRGAAGTGGGIAGITNAIGGGRFAPIRDFHLRELTLQGLRTAANARQNGAFLVNINGFEDVSVQDVALLDSRGFSLGLFRGRNAVVRGVRVARSLGDSIAVWDVADALITGNRVEMSGDDSISLHSNDNAAGPVRSGLVVSDNLITDGPGIHILGAKLAVVTGNVLRRVRGHGINVGFDSNYKQGNTAVMGVSIRGNVIADVYASSGFAGGTSNESVGIRVRGPSRQAGPLPGRPGSPGVPLQGTAEAPAFYANRQANRYGPFIATGEAPGAGGRWLVVEGNQILRTLPAVARWSQWGYGRAVQVGVFGEYDGPMTDAALSPTGIMLEGSLGAARIAGNTVQTGGPNGIAFWPDIQPMDFDGLEITGNQFIDFSAHGIFWPTGTPSAQRIRIADNLFDGDPGQKGLALGTRRADGSWTGVGAAQGGIYAAFLSGAEIAGNRFRNVFIPVTQSAQAMNLLHGNLVFAEPVGVGVHAGNKGVAVIPPAGGGFSHVIEASDPRDPRYGQVLSPILTGAPAQPREGRYVQGHFVRNTAPDGPAAPLGWLRLTTGDGHAAGRDWVAK